MHIYCASGNYKENSFHTRSFICKDIHGKLKFFPRSLKAIELDAGKKLNCYIQHCITGHLMLVMRVVLVERNSIR